MTQATAILGLSAQSSIHAGTGSNTGVIDLPIQREGHNGYPCVFGSSMKGALRNHAEFYYPPTQKDKKSIAHPQVATIFGADVQTEGNTVAGSLMVSDARLLLLPIRSLTSQFKWVTCPDVLKRYQRDAERFGLTVSAIHVQINDNQACVHKGCGNSDLLLEEYRFSSCEQDLSGIIEDIAQLMQRDDAKAALEKQLVIVSNDMFAHLCQHATPVNAHIAIDSATKTVTSGALWYEETLPPETLLYVGLAANRSRTSEQKAAVDILQEVLALFNAGQQIEDKQGKPWLQIGGNETVGMGWCAVSTLKGA